MTAFGTCGACGEPLPPSSSAAHTCAPAPVAALQAYNAAQVIPLSAGAGAPPRSGPSAELTLEQRLAAVDWTPQAGPVTWQDLGGWLSPR